MFVLMAAPSAISFQPIYVSFHFIHTTEAIIHTTTSCRTEPCLELTFEHRQIYIHICIHTYILKTPLSGEFNEKLSKSFSHIFFSCSSLFSLVLRRVSNRFLRFLRFLRKEQNLRNTNRIYSRREVWRYTRYV